MEMKNPVHPGLLVKECLDDLGLTVAEAAAALHITRQQLHNIVAGRSGVTPEMAIRFEKTFGGTADTWLRMQVNYDLAQRAGMPPKLWLSGWRQRLPSRDELPIGVHAMPMKNPRIPARLSGNCALSPLA